MVSGRMWDQGDSRQNDKSLISGRTEYFGKTALPDAIWFTFIFRLVTWGLLGYLACSLLIYKRRMNRSALWPAIHINSTWYVNAPIGKFAPTHCHTQYVLEDQTPWKGHSLACCPTWDAWWDALHSTGEFSVYGWSGARSMVYSLQKWNTFLSHSHRHLLNPHLCRSSSNTPLYNETGASKLLGMLDSTNGRQKRNLYCESSAAGQGSISQLNLAQLRAHGESEILVYTLFCTAIAFCPWNGSAGKGTFPSGAWIWYPRVEEENWILKVVFWLRCT